MHIHMQRIYAIDCVSVENDWISKLPDNAYLLLRYENKSDICDRAKVIIAVHGNHISISTAYALFISNAIRQFVHTFKRIIKNDT